MVVKIRFFSLIKFVFSCTKQIRISITTHCSTVLFYTDLSAPGRADFWNRANVFPIYLIKRDTAPETVREPVSLKEGRLTSNLTDIRFVEVKIWVIRYFFSRCLIDHVITF